MSLTVVAFLYFLFVQLQFVLLFAVQPNSLLAVALDWGDTLELLRIAALLPWYSSIVLLFVQMTIDHSPADWVASLLSVAV